MVAIVPRIRIILITFPSLFPPKYNIRYRFYVGVFANSVPGFLSIHRGMRVKITWLINFLKGKYTMRKNILIATLIGMSVIGLTACSRSDENKNTNDSTPATAMAQPADQNQAAPQQTAENNAANPAADAQAAAPAQVEANNQASAPAQDANNPEAVPAQIEANNQAAPAADASQSISVATTETTVTNGDQSTTVVTPGANDASAMPSSTDTTTSVSVTPDSNNGAATTTTTTTTDTNSN